MCKKDPGPDDDCPSILRAGDHVQIPQAATCGPSCQSGDCDCKHHQKFVIVGFAKHMRSSPKNECSSFDFAINGGVFVILAKVSSNRSAALAVLTSVCVLQVDCPFFFSIIGIPSKPTTKNLRESDRIFMIPLKSINIVESFATVLDDTTQVGLMRAPLSVAFSLVCSSCLAGCD